MRLRSLTLLAVLALSCEPIHSARPLSDPASAKADARLQGLWEATVDGKPMFLHVVPHPDGQMDLVLVGDAKHGAATLHYQGHATEHESARYLSLRAKSIPDPMREKYDLAPGWIFAKYELAKDGALTLSWMDEELPAKAIEAGTLGGKAPKGAKAEIDDEPAKIFAFIKSADRAKLWVSLARFQKMKLPSGK